MLRAIAGIASRSVRTATSLNKNIRHKSIFAFAFVLTIALHGYAQRLTAGMVRARFREGLERPSLIEPGRIYQYSIDLWNTCQTFKQGHSIRVEVASTAFPKYDRNPNTGEALGTSTRLETATQKIYHDRERSSYILLPIVPRRPMSSSKSN